MRAVRPRVQRSKDKRSSREYKIGSASGTARLNCPLNAPEITSNFVPTKIDFTIVDVEAHLAATKNRRLQAGAIVLFTTLVRFLQDNELSTRVLLADQEDVAPTFLLKRSDLTDEGFIFLQAALHKWVGAIEAAKCPPSDTTILERQLAKIRGQGSTST
jgi:hypothetical protein